MFDDYLRERAERTGEPFAPFDADARLRRVRRRQAALRRRALVPRVARDRRSRTGTPDDHPAPRPSTAWATARTTSCCELIARRRRRGLRGLGPLRPRRARRRAAPRRRLVERELPRRPRGGRASLDLFEEIVDGVVADARGPEGQARARHVPRAARAGSAWTPPRAAVFEDAVAGVEAGRAGRVRVRRRRRPRRPRRRAARARRGRRRPTTSPSCSTRPARDRAPRLQRRAVGAARDRAEPRRPRPERVAVRAGQRPHRPARQPRRGRAQRAARARTSTASTRSGRCRTPRRPTATPRRARPSLNVTDGKLMRLLVDDELFDVRYGELLEHERVLDLRAGVLRRRVHWRSPAGAAGAGAHRRGIVSLAQRGAAAILYEVEPVDERHPRRRAVRARRQRGRPAAGARATTRAPPPRWRPRSCAEEHYQHDQLVLLVHRTAHQRAADGGGDGPRGATAPTARPIDVEATPDVAARDDRRRRRRPARSCGSSSSSPTGGRATAPSTRSARPGPRQPGRGARTPAWTGCARPSASTSTASGRAPTSRSRATPSSSRRSASPVPRAAVRRARRAAGDRRRRA